MSNIGLRLFQQLKAIDPEVSRDDYFDEEHHIWDVEGLEEDLKVAQDRLQQTGSTSINNNNPNASTNTTQLQTQLPSLNTTMNTNNNNNNTYLQSLPPINAIPMNTNTIVNRINNTSIPSNPNVNIINNNNNTSIAMPANRNAMNSINSMNTMNGISNGIIQMNSMNVNEDIDMNPMDTNPTQMPSPNASPSIEFDDKNDNNDNINVNVNVMAKAHNAANINNAQNINMHLKRKNENNALPMIKKQKLNGNEINKWNDLALKKLFSLKRQVKNSAFFWEPVDEVIHHAPNYYLVCPLPSDYGTICKKLEKREYNKLDDFLRDCELVFINARLYNTSVHVVHKASMNLEKKFKELMNTFVIQHSKEYGSQKTMYYWQNAKKNYKPFAVPIDQ